LGRHRLSSHPRPGVAGIAPQPPAGAGGRRPVARLLGGADRGGRRSVKSSNSIPAHLILIIREQRTSKRNFAKPAT